MWMTPLPILCRKYVIIEFQTNCQKKFQVACKQSYEKKNNYVKTNRRKSHVMITLYFTKS